MKEKYLPTGNEYVALPTIRERDGAVEQINVLHMGVNGLLAFSGGSRPFLTPSVAGDGKEISLESRLCWEREADWLPRFTLRYDSLELEGLYFVRAGEWGFGLSFKV